MAAARPPMLHHGRMPKRARLSGSGVTGARLRQVIADPTVDCPATYPIQG